MNQKRCQISLCIDKGILEFIDCYAQETGCKRAEIIRVALAAYVDAIKSHFTRKLLESNGDELNERRENNR